MPSLLVPLAVATVLAATPPPAPTPPKARLPEICDALEDDARAIADEVLGSARGYGCCAGLTLAACLASPRPCSLGPRLASDVCRRARLGADKAAIEDALERRRKTMAPTDSPAIFALDALPAAGDPKAPVTAVVFACSRCPFCKEVVLGLHREVTEGELKGKVRLYLRPFPLKGHDGAAEGDLALMAAARVGRLWPYALFQFKHFDEFHPAVLADWAEFAGIERSAFERTLEDPKTREALVESKKEGVRYKVEGTPTLFVDGRRWHYDLDLDASVDGLLEEYERKTSTQ